MSAENLHPMGEEEAHEEANILRVKAGISPESGKVEGLDMRQDHEPTAEDYDAALASVEELKRLAKEHPDALEKLDEFLNSSSISGFIALGGLGAQYINRIKYALTGSEPGGPKERWRRSAGMIDLMANFHSVEVELHKLKSKAEQFGKKEVERGTE